MANRYDRSDAGTTPVETVGDQLAYESVIDQIARLDNQGETEVRVEYLQRVTGLAPTTIRGILEQLAGEGGPSPATLPSVRFEREADLLVIESRPSDFTYRSDLEERSANTGEYCPECRGRLSHQSGCRTCRLCGWEECRI